MKIKLIKGKKGDCQIIDIKEGVTAEEIYFRHREEFPYTALIVKIDNEYKPLTTKIFEECTLEFLDIRVQAANLVYQSSLSLVLLAAIYKVLGSVRVEIANSLNQGLFTEIIGRDPMTDEELSKVAAVMRSYIRDDRHIIREEFSRKKGISLLENTGQSEKFRLLKKSPQLKRLTFYSIDGYRNFFYGIMAPSTGYVSYFELKRYKSGVVLRFPLPAKPDELPKLFAQPKLYKAFGEQTRWDKLLGINYVEDLNEKIQEGRCGELIQLSEALHEKKIAEIADMIKKEGKRIILIAGPSSSGKTTFARRLCIQLKVNGISAMYMGTDDYFVERNETPIDENGERNYEDIEAVDIGLFNRNMNDLLTGKEADIPTFDFMTGQKVFGKRLTRIDKNQAIVIEGIHGLNSELTKEIPDSAKFKIYISPLTQLNVDEHNRIPTTDERMLRRLVRDYQFRGHSAADTIKLWPKVRAGEDKNIFPYSNEADVLFNSYHAYEIAVLKKYAEPLLREIGEDQEEYAEAQRMLQFLDFFMTITDDSVIVNNSILREFIGGSIFV